MLLCAPLSNLGIPAGLKTGLDRIHTDIQRFPGFGITRPPPRSAPSSWQAAPSRRPVRSSRDELRRV